MKYTLNPGESRSYGAQGIFLFVKDAAEGVGLEVQTGAGRVSSYEINKSEQLRFPDRIVKITLTNAGTLPQTIEIETGEAEYIPNNDGQKVTLTGQDLAIEVSTDPGAPLDVVGPLTDTELRATPVNVLGPLTDAELRADAVTIVQAASISGGTERNRLMTAASTNATSIKATPGQVYAINGTNTTAGTLYLKYYDKATAPTVGTDTPLETYALPPGPFSFAFPLGSEFLVGIALAITGGIADADTTPTAVNDVVMQTHFA